MEISKTADEALRVLLSLGGSHAGRTPASIARELDLNRTVVHRHLATLAARGFVRRVGSDPVYVLGTALLELAAGVEPEIRRVALPVMRELARSTGETALLCTPDLAQSPPGMLILDQVLAERHVVRVKFEVGRSVPMSVAAGGRVLLAFLRDGAARERAIAAAPDPELCLGQVRSAAALGYAASRDELLPDVAGIGAPVLDSLGYAVASLSIAVPVSRGESLPSLLPALLAAAAEIAGALQAAGTHKGD